MPNTLRVGPDSTRAELTQAVRVLNARAHGAGTWEERVALQASVAECLGWWVGAPA